MDLTPSSEHSLDRKPGPRIAYPATLAEAWWSLTPTQRVVAELAAQGFEEKTIAGRMGIKAGTVAKHKSNIGGKIPGAGTTASRIARAYAVICGASTEGVDPSKGGRPGS